MLKVTWRGKLQAVNFEEEFTRYGEEWTDYVTLEDLITKLSHTTKVPFERIKLLHSGAMMKDLNAPLSMYNLRQNSRVMMIGDFSETEQLTKPSIEVGLLQKLKEYKNLASTIIPKVKQLELAIDEGAITKEIDYLSKEISEHLLQLLLKVDGVVSDVEIVRQERKDVVKYINKYLDQVDSLKVKMKAAL